MRNAGESVNGNAHKLFAVSSLLVVMLALVSCGGALGGALGDSDEEAELGDEVTFVVPYSPGGGFDETARILAPYLETYLPGNPNVVVENIPGGNGAIAINEVMSAQPDGQTIMISNVPGHHVAPLTGQADYDLTEMEWIGLPAETTYVATASTESGVETLEDLEGLADIDVAIAALTDTSSVAAQVALDDLGLSSEVNLVAHEGSSEAILSAIRGDTDYAQFPYGSLREQIVNSDDLTPLWVYSEERLEDLPETPTFEEVGIDPDLLDVISLYRPIGTTPETPPELLEVHRDALSEAMQDPELIEEMEEGALEPEYADAEETSEIVQNSLEQMQQYRDLLE